MSFSIVARSDVDSWHAEVEAALNQKSKQFEEEIKKAEEGQGWGVSRFLLLKKRIELNPLFFK